MMMKRLTFLSILFVFVVKIQAQNYKEITLADIWLTPKFAAKSWKDIVPANNSKFFYVLEDNKLNLYNYQTGELTKTIVDGNLVSLADSTALNIESFEFDATETKLLIATATEPIYRRSSKSKYVLYDIKTSTATTLSDNGKQQLATFSPDGSHIAFVRENNVYVKQLSSNKEYAITTDGKFNNIINGAPDWVYEEEFEFAKAFEWSPDGSKIAYLKFDESAVKEYNMQKWDGLYPEDYKYKYPKAGEDNSIVSVNVYHLNSKRTIPIDLGSEKDLYIPRLQYVYNDNTVSIIRLNRLQSTLDVLHADVNSGKSEIVYHEENKAYVDLSNFTFQYLQNEKGFVITSEKDGWNQLYLIDVKEKKETQITKGEWEVVDVAGIDEMKNVIYYVSTEEGSIQRQLYSTTYVGKFVKQKITKEAGTHSISFNSNYTYYVDVFSSANVPPTFSIFKYPGKLIKTLEDNSKLKMAMTEYHFQSQEFFTFKNSDSISLNGFMIKPGVIDPKIKYPVLMVFYGGPGSQEVADKWGYSDFSWHQMLVQKGYIVVCVDGRGTGYKGEKFKKCTYLQLGNFETLDQIAAAKYLATLTFIDKDRIGVWGWSFGGYLSTLCMTKGGDFFKAGIAVAPVTNWRYYDNIYTERFMRKPIDNSAGYDENSPINHVKKLKGKFLLVHGSADDNVHIQNSYQLIDALVKNNKQFDMQFYTNKNHSIYGGFTRYHLFTKMTDFILQNL